MIRILIVDDNRLMRRGLRSLLAKEADLEVVGEARDGEEALALAANVQPDLVLLDLNMPRLAGLPATERLHALPTHPCVLIVSMHPDAVMVREALKRGACGFVLKQDCFTELIPAIRSAAAGTIYISPSLADFASDEKSQTAARPHDRV